MTDVAASTPAYTYNPVAVEKATNPNKKYRWLIPLLVAAQIALKVHMSGSWGPMLCVNCSVRYLAHQRICVGVCL